MAKEKKQLTVEQLAGMVQREFTDIRETMVTKTEFREAMAAVDRRFDTVIAHMDETKREIVAVVRAIRDEKVEQLERDMATVKKKLGIA